MGEIYTYARESSSADVYLHLRTMEVDIRISTSLDKIVSPCSLTAEIGVPSGAKLRLFRDPFRAGQSRMVVCCDKPTASRLRRRFSAPRVYAHDGQLLSLAFVGMRPIADRHPESVPRGLYGSGATATKVQEKGEARGGREARKPARAQVVSRPSSSPAAGGVEFALEWVEQAEADGRRVPGIADLYEEFMRTRKQHSDGEEKSRDIAEEKECAPPSSSAQNIRSRPRPRHCSPVREEKGEKDAEEEKKGEEKKQNSVAKTARQRQPTASHKQRCRQRDVVVSVDDVTCALNRISSNFADAPRPVERIGIVSLLAKIYAEGAAFADNRPRCCEALDHLGIARWHAVTYPRVSTQAAATATLEPPNTAPGEGWLRILRRVVGLVRAVIDFGAFVQVYVAAAERERFSVSAATAAVNEEKTRDGDQGQGERKPRTSRKRGDKHVSPRVRDEGPTTEDRNGLGLTSDSSRGRGASPETVDADAEIIERQHLVSKEELPVDSYPLKWLFPNSTEEGGKLAFNRHAVSGSAVHAKTTLEAAARIVRDAGRAFPSERAWRWCCEKKILEGGRLLTFQDFVELCEALKEHMVAAPLVSPEDRCTSTAVSPIVTVDLP